MMKTLFNDSRPFEFKIWKGVPYTDKAEVIALAI